MLHTAAFYEVFLFEQCPVLNWLYILRKTSRPSPLKYIKTGLKPQFVRLVHSCPQLSGNRCGSCDPPQACDSGMGCSCQSWNALRGELKQGNSSDDNAERLLLQCLFFQCILYCAAGCKIRPFMRYGCVYQLNLNL